MSPEPGRRYRWLLHIDLDQFQVSVERLRNPDLTGVPVIVGGNGDPTEARKVVTCASYEARDVGVRAGMPLRTAYRKLPDAVYLPLDTAAYDAASAAVMATLRDRGLPVEVWGWDEAYLGVGELGPDRVLPEQTPHDPTQSCHAEFPSDTDIVACAGELRALVAERTGLSCCLGVSDNKQRAKMATGFAKHPQPGTTDGLRVALPPKVFLLDGRNWLPLMAHRPPRDLFSVGPRTAQRLAGRGIDTVAQLIDTRRDDLIAEFGPHQGNWLYVLCRGGGDATITVQPDPARSHSKSRTFPVDLTDPTQTLLAATELTRELLDQVVAEGRIAFRIAVTVRTSTFYTRTKSRKLAAPTVDPDEVLPVVADLLDQFEQGRPIRLLGVRVDLVDTESGRPR